jgi:superfamily I DNA/RNA helicase
LYDDIQAICVLSEGLTNVDELISKINTVFMGNENDAIVLSTVHKAKGLEADNIFIYYPSLMPLKLATKDWEIKTEDNLIYVAYTRAKKTLNFMKEDKYNHRMNGYFNIDKMKSQLDIIKEKIKYNKELGVTEKNYEQQIQTKPSIKLGEENKVQPIQNKKIKAGIKMRDFL